MKVFYEYFILALIAVTGYCIYHFIDAYDRIAQDSMLQVIGVLLMFVVLCILSIYFYFRWFPDDEHKRT